MATSLVSMQLAIAGLSALSEGAFWPGIAKLPLAALGLSLGAIRPGSATGRRPAVRRGRPRGFVCGTRRLRLPHGARRNHGDGSTGLLATVAGFTLVALAFRIALQGRRRLAQMVLGVSAAFVIVQWGFVQIVGAGLASERPSSENSFREHSRAARSTRRRVEAGDGTRLAGWFVPGRTRAAVILLHGSHGTRADTKGHLRMLVRAGFAVLAFDARGHGQSDGETNALGWRGASDVAGAITFLRRQPHVDATRIAALGLSMGGEEALRAASSGVQLAAVIADGAGASTQGDQRLASHGLGAPIAISSGWLMMREVELLSGDDEPRPLKDIVGDIHVPVLLIASNAPGELTIDKVLRGPHRPARQSGP